MSSAAETQSELSLKRRGRRRGGAETRLKRVRPPLTAVWTLEHGKDVHGARLGDRLAEQPQQLLIAERGRGALRDEPGRVVQPELEPARATGPRAHLVAHREQRDAAAAAARGVADVGARRGADHVERCVARG